MSMVDSVDSTSYRRSRQTTATNESVYSGASTVDKRAAGSDQYLVLKPQQQRQRPGTARGASPKRRFHPWMSKKDGPMNDGPMNDISSTAVLPDVDMLQGDTERSMGSTWGGDEATKRSNKKDWKKQGFYKSPSQRLLAQQLSTNKASDIVKKALRLDQEEEDDHFHSRKIRKGIENARRKSRGLPAQHWKTPYEVDAPRAIMLPREHPQETSSSGKSSSTGTGSLSVEQKIWQGIEQLMADAFSDEDHSTGSSALPEALVKAISEKSLFNDQSSYTKSRRSSSTSASQDEIEMAHMALSSFMDMIMPADDESSLPSLATYRLSLDGQAIPENAPYELALAEVALNNFMEVLVRDVEKTHKPSALTLLDLFSWTMRVNVDDVERRRFEDGQEEQVSERNLRRIEDDLRRRDEQEEQVSERNLRRIEEDLRRRDELLRRKEAEEEELRRLEEEGRRIEEMLREKLEVAERLRKAADESTEREYEIQLKDDAEDGRKLKPVRALTAAEQRRNESELRQRELEGIISAEEEREREVQSKEEELQARFLLLSERQRVKGMLSVEEEKEREVQSKEEALKARFLLLSQEAERKSVPRPTLEDHLPPRGSHHGEQMVEKKPGFLRAKLEDESPRQGKRTPSTIDTGFLRRQMSQMSSMSIPTLDSMTHASVPTLATLDTEDQDSPDEVDRRDVMRTLKRSPNPSRRQVPHSPKWASIGGAPIVVSGDEDGSIDPTTLRSPGGRQKSKRAAYSSTELRNRMTDKSSANFSTHSVPMVMPSESKRTSKAAMIYEESEPSLDPDTLPNLADVRRGKKAAAAQEELDDTDVSRWAAIGGRPIMMPERLSISPNDVASPDTGSSPDTAHSGVLPSSFHEKSRLSSSGSISKSSKTLTTLSAGTYNNHPDASSVYTSEDLPDLRSISDASFGGDSSSSGSAKDSAQKPPPPPRLFATTYSPRGSKKSTKKLNLGAEDDIFKDNIFTESFLDRMENSDKPQGTQYLPSSFAHQGNPSKQQHLPSSFAQGPKTPTPTAKPTLPSSFAQGPKTPTPTAKPTLPSSFAQGPLTMTPDPFAGGNPRRKAALPSSFVHHTNVGQAMEKFSPELSPPPSPSKSPKKKKDKKRKKKKKKHKDMEVYEPRSQRNLVVSAAGDIFMDDLLDSSLNRLPSDHFDKQITPPDALNISRDSLDPSVTEVKSIGSAGDIHLGSSVVTASHHDTEEEDSVDSDMSIDLELQLDEIRMDGPYNDVPETKSHRRSRLKHRNGGPVKRILKRFSRCVWLPARRRHNLEQKNSEPLLEIGNNSDQCLLHEEDGPYDRTPVMGGELPTIDEDGFSPL